MYIIPIDKRETVEHIFGEFGFTLRWRVSDHWADVEVFQIVCMDGDTPEYNRRGWITSPDPVREIDEAEPYLEGFVKWDACAELNMGQPHWCGVDDFKNHCALLEHIYGRAFQLMGHEPEETWK